MEKNMYDELADDLPPVKECQKKDAVAGALAIIYGVDVAKVIIYDDGGVRSWSIDGRVVFKDRNV